MLTGILMVGLSLWLALASAPPKFQTPAEVAKWAKCEPAEIGRWIDSRILYAKQESYEPSIYTIAKGRGDCKGRAVIARDALNTCSGFKEIRLIRLKHLEGGIGHATTFYERDNGRRGFVNGGTNLEFDAGTGWGKVVDGVPGGPWAIRE